MHFFFVLFFCTKSLPTASEAHSSCKCFELSFFFFSFFLYQFHTFSFAFFKKKKNNICLRFAYRFYSKNTPSFFLSIQKKKKPQSWCPRKLGENGVSQICYFLFSFFSGTSRQIRRIKLNFLFSKIELNYSVNRNNSFGKCGVEVSLTESQPLRIFRCPLWVRTKFIQILNIGDESTASLRTTFSNLSLIFFMSSK